MPIWVTFLIAAILWYIVAYAHGRIWTEAYTIGGSMEGWGIASRWASAIAFFILAMYVVSPLYNNRPLLSGQDIRDFTIAIRWWLVIVPLVLIGIGIYKHRKLEEYSLSEFKKAHPDYEKWPEFKQHADRRNSTTYIHIGRGSWWPFKSSDKPSLNQRVEWSRSHRSNSRSGGGSSYRSGAALGDVARSAFSAPILSRSHRGSSKSSMGKSHRSSSRGGGSGSDAGKAAGGAGVALMGLLKLIVNFLVLIFLLLLVVLVFFVVYKMVEGIMEFYDTQYTLKMSAEEYTE